MFLLGVAAHVGKRKDRYGGRFSKIWCRCDGLEQRLRFGYCGPRFQADCINLDWLIESLDLLLTQILVFERQPLRQRLVSRSLNTNTSWLGQLLQTLCQYYSLTGYRIISNHYFSHRDTNSKHGSNVIGKLLIVGGVGGLENQ